MMERLIARAEGIARDAQQKQVHQVAGRLRGLFGEAAVEVGDAQARVRGRGILKRWLVDPSLRFLGGDLR